MLNIELLEGEIFKPYPKSPHYLVSNMGRVYSHHINKLIKPRVDDKGYVRVHISCIKTAGGYSKQQKMHRVVMETFIGESTLSVNHISENKLDNRLSNLEYLTTAENTKKHALNKQLTKQALFLSEYPQCKLYTLDSVKGYYWMHEKNYYKISLPINGANRYFGAAKSEEEAKTKVQIVVRELRKLQIDVQYEASVSKDKCFVKKQYSKQKAESINIAIPFVAALADFEIGLRKLETNYRDVI